MRLTGTDAGGGRQIAEGGGGGGAGRGGVGEILGGLKGRQEAGSGTAAVGGGTPGGGMGSGYSDVRAVKDPPPLTLR